MKLVLTFPGAKFKIVKGSRELVDLDPDKWCWAHVFTDGELFFSVRPEELRWKELDYAEELFFKELLKDS